MRASLLMLILGISISCLQAQPIGKSSYETMLEIAAEKVEAGDFYNALTYYEKAYEEREDRKLLPMIAEMSLKIRDYAKAQRTYANVFRRDKENEYADLRFDYGRALKMYERYPEAIEQFQLFISETTDPVKKELAENEVTGAEMAVAFAEQNEEIPEDQQPDRISRKVNKAFSEYSPAYGRDGSLYFVTFEAEDVIEMDIDGTGPTENYARIFRTTMGKRDWEDPAPLDVKINRPGFHSSNASFSKDGNAMYFTRQILSGNTLVTSDIFFSVGGDDAWNAPNEVVGINGEHLAMHPAMGELFGREVLFFVSDMDGGQGGLDIYYAPHKGEGVFGDPVNLGPKVNTPADEITPFYYDGTLYFSSEGHPGFGGQDIFYTVWNGTIWSEPRNMGGVYNSAQDDQYFTLDNQGYKGFFTSNRPGGRSVKARTCCDDIYGFEIPEITADLVVGTFDAQKKMLKGATVDLVELSVMGAKVADSKTDQKGNRFDFPLGLDKTYQVMVSAPGYFPDSLKVNTGGLKESKVFTERVYLKKKPEPKPEPKEPEYDTVTIEQAIVLENILYDFDDDKILPAAESDLQVVLELMAEYPNMKIEMGSHTDSRGRASYNESLSQRRAESARQWLIERGVAAERIVAKGYGENQPKEVTERVAEQHSYLNVGDVLTEAFINKLQTEDMREEAHQVNRRTEFRILEGPTSIRIQRTRLLKKGAERKSNIEEKGDAKTGGTSFKISNLSTLYGKKSLKGMPVMVFRERMVDFGAVKKGEKREHIYEFTNMGDTDLIISIVSACDCTTASYEKDTYKPGESGQLKIVFDSTEKEESEVIDVDVILENEDENEVPIIERVQYKFELVK